MNTLSIMQGENYLALSQFHTSFDELTEPDGDIVAVTSLEEPVHLVRHGRYTDATGRLTGEGVQQSEIAQRVLIEKGLAERAILLSSSALRAQETAEILAEGLRVPLHSSRRLDTAGHMPYVVEDLDDFLDETLRQLGVERENGQPMVVVAHAPLIAMAKGLGSAAHSVDHGEVFPYTPGTWDGLFFDHHEEQLNRLMLMEPR